MPIWNSHYRETVFIMPDSHITWTAGRLGRLQASYAQLNRPRNSRRRFSMPGTPPSSAVLQKPVSTHRLIHNHFQVITHHYQQNVKQPKTQPHWGCLHVSQHGKSIKCQEKISQSNFYSTNMSQVNRRCMMTETSHSVHCQTIRFLAWFIGMSWRAELTDIQQCHRHWRPK